MKTRAMISLLLVTALSCVTASAAEIKKGDKLQTLINLHPDMNKRKLYTMNYQLGAIIPICTEVTIKSVSGKKLSFDYQGTEFTLEYDKHTSGAGVSFQEAAQQFFGPACDKAKMNSLSQIDKEGIQSGTPRIGMSKDGVLLAMGRPPKHATPSLESSTWMYWQNRYGKQALEFDAKGKVSKIID